MLRPQLIETGHLSSELQPVPEEHLYERIATILDESRSRVARSINTAMVHAYWFIGREIVEVEQRGAERAGYGEGLMKRVAVRLSARFGKGFSLASLKRMKQFYLAFPGGSALVGTGDRKSSTLLNLSAEVDGGEKGLAVLSLSPSVCPDPVSWLPARFKRLRAVPTRRSLGAPGPSE